jgi:hypothetical protein
MSRLQVGVVTIPNPLASLTLLISRTDAAHHNMVSVGIRPSDLLAAEHAILLANDYLAWRSKPMAVPMSTMFRTTGTVRLPRVRTKRAEVLARSNVRYLLGCLIAVGFPRQSVSLDMFAYEEVVRAFLVCIDTRKLGSERRYQVSLFCASPTAC